MANDRYEEGNEGPGTLTALPRREWAKMKQKLLKRGNNKEAFAAFDSALLTISLDLAAAPRDKTDAISLVQYGAMKHGKETFTSTNRNFEGPSIVIAGDTTAGVNCEHYSGDGSEYMFFAKKLEEKAKNIHFDKRFNEVVGIEAAFSALSFDIPESDLKRGLKNYQEVIDNQSMKVIEVPIGNQKEYPDAVVQLAIHLTKYLVKGRTTFSIIPVSVRHRRNGRIGYASPNTSKIESYVDRHILVEGKNDEPKITPTVTGEKARKRAKNAITSMKDMVKEVKAGTAPLSHITALASAASGRSIMEQVRGTRTEAGLRSRAWWLKKQEGFFTAIDRGLYYMIRGDVISNGGAQEGVDAFSTIASKGKNGMSIGFTTHDNKIVFSLRMNGESQKDAKKYGQLLPQALETVHKDYVNSTLLAPKE